MCKYNCNTACVIMPACFQAEETFHFVLGILATGAMLANVSYVNFDILLYVTCKTTVHVLCYNQLLYFYS